MRPQTVHRLIEAGRPATPKIGVVAAVGTTTVDVRMTSGTVTPGLQYSAAYVPALGDRVLVVPADTAWVVLCKVSPEPKVVPDREVRVKATRQWVKARAVSLSSIPAGTWYYQWEGASSGYPVQYAQGRFAIPSGGPGWVPEYSDWCALTHYGSLAALVPSGSTITGLAIVVRRSTGGQGAEPLVNPIMYAHTYDTATAPASASAPVWAAGFGPLIYPGVAMGEQTRLVLPSSWVAAWLAGTIKGIGFWSDKREQAGPYWDAPGDGDLVIMYTPPPDA